MPEHHHTCAALTPAGHQPGVSPVGDSPVDISPADVVPEGAARDGDPPAAAPSAVDPGSVAPSVLWPGVVLGLLGDQLIFADQHPLPSGFALWVSLLGLSVLWQADKCSSAVRRMLQPWVALAAGLSLLLVWRSSGPLVPGVWLSLALCLGFVLLYAQGGQRHMLGMGDMIALQVQIARQLLTGWYSSLQGENLRSRLDTGKVRARVRGALLTLPLLVVFSVLFAQADAVFNHFLGNLLGNVSDQWIRHLGLSLVCCMFSLGVLHLSTTPLTLTLRGPRHLAVLGLEELRIILGSLCVLFTGFGVLQLSYLFGGRELIMASEMTVSAYARRGFYELLIAVILTLGLLLLLHSVAVRTRVFTWCGGILVGCVLVLLLSAVQRMVMYVDSYGLTMDRLTALAIIGWLGLCLLLFTSTVLRNRPAGFASGAALRFIAVVLVFALSNPAGLIARVNLDRHLRASDPLDLQYLLTMGPDATTVVLQHYPDLDDEQQCILAQKLNYQLFMDPRQAASRLTRLLGWQAARAAEQRAFALHEEALRSWRTQAASVNGAVSIGDNAALTSPLQAEDNRVQDEDARRCAVLIRSPSGPG